MRDHFQRRPDQSQSTRDRSPDEVQHEDTYPIQRPRLRRRGRSDARDREVLKQLIRDIPSFLKLLGRLARDPRVSRVDKAIVLATIGYLLMPTDFIPDYIPFLGQVDDIYLLALALDRLMNNAGIDLLLEHWDGDVGSLEAAVAALDRAGSFLPSQVRTLVRSVLRDR